MVGWKFNLLGYKYEKYDIFAVHGVAFMVESSLLLRHREDLIVSVVL